MAAFFFNSCKTQFKMAKKQNRQKLFHLNDVGNTARDVQTFGKLLVKNLGDDIFKYKEMNQIIFHLLKQISSIKKTVKPNDESIEAGCQKVMRRFGLNFQGVLYALTENGPQELLRKNETNRERFCRYIIELSQPPALAYEKLSAEVTQDLKSITDLIRWYETQPSIEKFLKNGDSPKNHEDRTVFDFYKRCTEERLQILDYQLYGIKSRALSKSSYIPDWARPFSIPDVFVDKPYYFGRFYSEAYFDYRKIDLAGHRVGEYYPVEAKKMQRLYAQSKAKFYRLYFKRNSAAAHLQQFSFYLSHLPFKNNRTLIFKELTQLFKSRRWIGFYALALPQIEGLFSEMCSTIAPDSNISRKALPDKVDLVRPHHDFSRSSFDYYQYHIPRLRNKFAHSGYDEDFKLKAYDLLLDLTHLLKVFLELKNPLVKIKKLHVRQQPNEFITVGDFVNYFKLLEQLKPQQRKEIQEEVLKFERDFLSVSCDLNYTCLDVIERLPTLAGVVDDINELFRQCSIAIDLKTVNTKALGEALEDEKIREAILDGFFMKSDSAEELFSCFFLVANHKKFIPSIHPEVKTQFDDLRVRYAYVSTLEYANRIVREKTI